MSAIAALVLVLLAGNSGWAAEPITARAGAARDGAARPSGPTPMVRRGMILPPRLLDVYVQPSIEQPVGVGGVRMAPALGALWGVAPELHADFQITPFYLPGYAAGFGRISITRRFMKTQPVDLGFSVMTTIDPSMPSLIGFVQPGMAAILRPNGVLRVDTGVLLPLFTTPDTHFGVRVPVNVYFQITDRIHCGATSTIFIGDLRDPQKTASIPVGLTAGYSAGLELDMAAFTPYISWANFYTPATGAVDTRSFVAGIIADVAFELP